MEQEEYVRVQNAIKTNAEVTKLKFKQWNLKKLSALKYTPQEAQEPKRSHANTLATDFRKKSSFTKITNNKEMPGKDNQEEKKIKNLPNQEASIEQRSDK